MSQVDVAPSLNNLSPSMGPSRGPSVAPSPAPVPVPNNNILGLSPSTVLMIVVGLIAFAIIYNYEKK
jgi:hypothetical protein